MCGLKVYNSLEEIKNKHIPNPVVTIGTFDGIHQGHQMILDELREKAKNVKGESVMVTFSPHPRKVLFPENDFKLVQTLEERMALLDDFGLDHLLVVNFTKEFSRLSAEQFVRDYLVNGIGLHTLLVGYDHQFGRNREGSYERLTELAPVYEFELDRLPPKSIHDLNISSTKIRNAVKTGNVDDANEYLGRPFTLKGQVVHGDKIGRTIGYPTANIKVPEEKLVPKSGVYHGKVFVDGEEFVGMMNIGTRPTVSGVDNRIEIHVLDFDEGLYDKTIVFSFQGRLRDELTFNSKEALKKQIQLDEKTCRDYYHLF